MSPQSMLPPHSHTTPGGGTRQLTTSVPNPDGSSNVYVHHISHGAPATPAPPQQQPQMQMPQMQMPQMMGIPYPMPMAPPPQPMYSPYPAYPPPPPPSYGCPYHYQQQCQQQQQQRQQQPTVVILNQEPPKPPLPKKEEKKKPEEEKKPEEKKPEEKPKEEKPPEPTGPQKFSKFSIVSVIMFALALIFGIASVFKTYEAFDAREAGVATDDEDYMVDRTVAIGTGGASTMCFTIATLSSFYAGMKHKSKSRGNGHCCLGGFLIAGWIIFCLTFINDLIVLVLAFDPDNIIYPEVVWSALIGSILSWMLMFGYSEMARRI